MLSTIYKHNFGGCEMLRYIEIRAAEGGDDSKLFVRDLANMVR
jgi:protein subunit release factor A